MRVKLSFMRAHRPPFRTYNMKQHPHNRVPRDGRVGFRLELEAQ